ncbi:MAG: hypothetical protein HOQ21_10085 [Dermatophilaceae bacterium]|nr:hypothetical protein [Dermatophilaceae bacterium]
MTVASKGGSHDDESYAAGWEMGALDVTLSDAAGSFHEQMIHAANAPQADLVAMKNGYTAEITPVDDNWSHFAARWAAGP